MYAEGILIHTAKIITVFLDKYGCDVIADPPYSPGLNPIEHVWDELKQCLYQKDPDILQTPGEPEAVKRRYVNATWSYLYTASTANIKFLRLLDNQHIWNRFGMRFQHLFSSHYTHLCPTELQLLPRQMDGIQDISYRVRLAT